MTVMEHWYVYYKLPHAQAPAVASRVRTMLGAVAATTSVQGRLLRRNNDDARTTTLMEQYDRIDRPEEFERALAEAVRDANLPAELVAQRRVERFEDF